MTASKGTLVISLCTLTHETFTLTGSSRPSTLEGTLGGCMISKFLATPTPEKFLDGMVQ